MTKAVVYACSHRKGGNTDLAADLLRRGVESGGGECEVIAIRAHTILHCLACGYCEKEAGKEGVERCILGRKDDAWKLFAPLFTARTVFFAAPIYFYHLPSMLKTWIDRSQQFWFAKNSGEPWVADLPRRTAHAVMVAGRPTGDKLFEGAAITLKYFLHNFNCTLADPLVLRGIDERLDLSERSEDSDRIVALGRTAWESSGQ